MCLRMWAQNTNWMLKFFLKSDAEYERFVFAQILIAFNSMCVVSVTENVAKYNDLNSIIISNFLVGLKV